MGYWPSYSGITPQCRAAYLAWLADGRRDPAAYIGYPFLFFYGLERRVTERDGPVDREELNAIAQEVEALLGVYATSSGSFRGYASRFLQVLQLKLGAADSARVDPLALAAPRDGLPILVRVGIARFAQEGAPLPWAWALAWALSSPEAALGASAARARAEFTKLFEIRYTRQFGAGMTVPTNRSRLALNYHPASASFGGDFEISTENLCDAASAKMPLRKVLAIAEECAAELEPYSRWLGRNRTKTDDIAGMALLPKELTASHASPRASQILERCTLAVVARESVDAGTLFAPWPGKAPDKLTKPESVLLLQLLEKAGYGIEPDVRFGGPTFKPDEKVVVFRQSSDAPGAPSRSYLGHALVIRLQAEVMKADGVVEPSEEAHLMKRIATLGIEEVEEKRLLAHARWLLRGESSLTGLKKRLEVLTVRQKEMVADFLISAAAADGQVAPEEIKTLTKVFKMLGVDSAQIHRRIHAHSTAGEPVLVALGEKAQTYAVPARPGGVVLNQARVQARQAESEQLAALLGEVFAPEEAEAQPAPLLAQAASFAGLDAPHNQLLAQLAERPRWERAEVEVMARALSLLPDGAIETINDAAFERCSAPVLEGDDPIELVAEILKELTP